MRDTMADRLEAVWKEVRRWQNIADARAHQIAHQRGALERIARLEDDYRNAGLPYDLDTGAQIALRQAGDIAREGLGLPARESAYDPPLGRSKT